MKTKTRIITGIAVLLLQYMTITWPVALAIHDPNPQGSANIRRVPSITLAPDIAEAPAAPEPTNNGNGGGKAKVLGVSKVRTPTLDMSGFLTTQQAVLGAFKTRAQELQEQIDEIKTQMVLLNKNQLNIEASVLQPQTSMDAVGEPDPQAPAMNRSSVTRSPAAPLMASTMNVPSADTGIWPVLILLAFVTALSGVILRTELIFNRLAKNYVKQTRRTRVRVGAVKKKR